MPWEEVKKEMLEKGLDEVVADKIGGYVKHKGGKEILTLLKDNVDLFSNVTAKKGIEEMEFPDGGLRAWLVVLGVRLLHVQVRASRF